MKKSVSTLAAVILALSSCSSEEELFNIESNEINEPAKVSLGVSIPDLAPRTRVTEDEANIPGKGHKINNIEFAIYDQSNTLVISSMDTTAANAMNAVYVDKDYEDHGHFTINVTLMKQHTYTFYVWASSKESPYKFDPTTKSVTVDYSKVKANDETMDAFFGKKKFTIADKQTADDQYTVILNRPFAQLNLMTNDTKYVKEHLNKTISSIEVTVTANPGRYPRLSLEDFKASGEQRDFTFKADFPNGWDDLVHAGSGDVADYYYLATCYLLTGVTPDGSLNGETGTEQEVTDLCITINYTDGTPVVINKSSVPIRRSWRTNIWGSLQTADADSNTRIDFNFDGANGDGPGADNGSNGPDDGDHSGDDNSNNETID